MILISRSQEQVRVKHTAARYQSRDVGISAITSFLIAVSPKCPLCWVALMSSMGAVSVIRSEWLQPMAVSLLLASALSLFVRARRRALYGPFLLGVLAATSIYLCRFRFDYDTGFYAGAIALFASSLWSALPRRKTSDTCAACLPEKSLEAGEIESTLQPKRRPVWLA
jgi:hypothetical protein